MSTILKYFQEPMRYLMENMKEDFANEPDHNTQALLVLMLLND